MGTPLALYVPFCMICGTPTSSIRVSLDPLGIVVLDTTKFDAFMCTVVPPPPASVVGVFPAFPVGVVPGRVQAANRMLPNANTTIDIVRNPNRFVLMTLIPLIRFFCCSSSYGNNSLPRFPGRSAHVPQSSILMQIPRCRLCTERLFWDECKSIQYSIPYHRAGCKSWEIGQLPEILSDDT